MEEIKWISVKDRLPDAQIECVFYAKLFEWWAGMYTPSGNSSGVFEYHQHWGDDGYHEIKEVTHWMPLHEYK